jgi:hypothetical protein
VNPESRYEAAKQDVLFTAYLTAKDPATYMDALRDAVDELSEAWNAYVDSINQPDRVVS